MSRASSIDKQPHQFDIEDDLGFEYETDLVENTHGNVFVISLSSDQILEGKNLYLQVLSDNEYNMLSIYNTETGTLSKKNEVILEMITNNGNIVMAMSDTYFNGKFNFFKETGKLYFKIENRQAEGPNNYKLKLHIDKELQLIFGKAYTVRVDYTIEKLAVDFFYNGKEEEEKNLTKIRFQANTVLHKDVFSMGAQLQDVTGAKYTLNNIFKNICGGVLDKENFKLCFEETCNYKIEFELVGVKVVDIETFLVYDSIEVLDINHVGEYYDRVYKQDQVTYYRLPYVPEMEELDLNVNLIPVTGDTGLFVNVQNKPLELEKYNFKIEHKLSKRIVVTWKELEEMKATKQDLYIAVKTGDRGEFMLKVDAHDNTFRGRLISGVTEVGFVQAQDIHNYLYTVDVYKTQEISFSVILNITSGNGRLYLKKCEMVDSSCIINNKNKTNKDVFRDESTFQNKSISHTFTCENKKQHQSQSCSFIIGVFGVENHGTHFSIEIEQSKQHLLMLPGNQTTLELQPKQEKYLKFSFPGNFNAKLFLQVEPLWGEFELFISRQEDSLNSVAASFIQKYKQQHGRYKALKNIDLAKEVIQTQIQGSYFILVKATTSSSVILKFYEKDSSEQIHTLSAGIPHKGTLLNEKSIQYYSINISLDNQKAKTISVDLQPIKGDFVLYANRNGKLPTKFDHQITSLNNQLNLVYEKYEKNHEYLIGIQSKHRDVSNIEYQITVNYASKLIKLSPGILGKYVAKETNQFLIQILPEMNDLLILKSIQDGYDIRLCANFNDGQEQSNFNKCHEKVDKKNVSLYLIKEQIDEYCEELRKNNKKCYLQIQLSGFMDQYFGLGFTYNNLPFQLTKTDILFGPSILKSDRFINFIYRPENNKPIQFYFNSKGRMNRIYSKLISGDEAEKEMDDIQFPTQDSNDEENTIKKGFITMVAYTKEEVGQNSEILLSVRTSPDHQMPNEDQIFDPTRSFHLQAYTRGKQLLRMEVFSEHIFEEMWNYYHFYSNGSEKELTIYVSSNHASLLELQVARNKDIVIPTNSKALKIKKGVDEVVMKLTEQELNNQMRGWFTIAVKSKLDTLIHIYWNNKAQLNYTELTPSVPSVVHLHKDKKLYFSFFAAGATKIKKKKAKAAKNETIAFHFKSDQLTKIYITRSKTNQIVTPQASKGDDGYYWKGTTGDRGGISTIEIKPEDEHYCVECTYVGLVESESEQTISMLANIEHKKVAITLSSGFTFPDNVYSHKGKLYRFVNPDDEPFYLMIQTLSGNIQAYIGDSKNTGINDHKDFYSFGPLQNNHIYKKIDPRDYQISKNGNIYIKIYNSKLDNASYVISIHKNNYQMPLEFGISKYLTLEGSEQAKLFFKKTSNLDEYEIRLTLTNIEDKNQHNLAHQTLKDTLQVVIDGKERYKDQVDLEPEEIQISNNIIYYKIKLNGLTDNSPVGIVIKNSLTTMASYQIDLTQNDYKLVNNNDIIFGVNKGMEKQIYESYGIPGRYWFSEIKMCYGKLKVRFAEDDYEKIRNKEFAKYETVDDANNSKIHYFRLNSKRVFAEISNDKSEIAVYKINMYNEEDLNESSYSKVTQINDGRVQVLTDQGRVEFYPVQLNLDTNPNFVHQVQYSLYFTQSFKVMRFLKNCGKNKLEEVFKQEELQDLKEYVLSKDLSTKEDMLVKKKLSINYEGLEPRSQYYGVLIASLQMFPTSEGWWIHPVRESRVYYDEIVYFTAKEYEGYIGFVSGIVISVIIFLVLILITWNFIFGELGNLDLENLSKFKDLGEGYLGIDVLGILESEYVQDSVISKESELTTVKDDSQTPLDVV